MVDLVQRYEKLLPSRVETDGFPSPPLLALHHDGRISMATLKLPPEIIFEAVMTSFMVDLTVKEIIFGIDRYTKSGQGTKYADVLNVFWWQGERLNQHHGWRFGVVNYRPPPRTRIEPIDWNNRFWNDLMASIVHDYRRRMLNTIARVSAEPGGDEMVEQYRQAVIEAQDRAQRGQKPS